MLAYHKQSGADVTISVLEVSMEEAKRFGIMNVDERDQICEFEEKPCPPKKQSGLYGGIPVHLGEAAPLSDPG